MNMVGLRTFFGYLLLGCLSLGAFSAPIDVVDPELSSGYYEGDMNVLHRRNGLLATTMHWPNATVYYMIEGFDELHADFIRHAMDTIENVSCVHFTPAEDDAENYVKIGVSSSGCWSNVGFNGGVQFIMLVDSDLNSGCFRVGTVQHELLHTLGFSHQHSASDRDNYIEIHWDNINPTAITNFNKLNASTTGNFGVIYDYGSVMHYPANAFAKPNTTVTITALQPLNGLTMGQRSGLSESDITRLNNMYRCGKPVNSTEDKTQTSTEDKSVEMKLISREENSLTAGEQKSVASEEDKILVFAEDMPVASAEE